MKICKYCGRQFSSKESWSVCCKCRRTADLLPRFTKARDELRRKCGLPPLEDKKL